MFINTNMGSLTAQRNLMSTQNAMQSALAQLSSGYRINQASDDAAGYAIAQKMQGQINGLNQAVQNSQNAISLVQTAQGALTETQSILQRMRALAVQSSSDTATDSDRQQIQLETNQLAQELSRISNTTEFNTKNLLAGGFSNQTFQIGANQGQNMTLNIGANDAYSLGVVANNNMSVNTGYNQSNSLAATNTFSITTASPLSIGGAAYSLSATESQGSITGLVSGSTGIDNLTLVASSTLMAGTSFQLQATIASTGSAGTSSFNIVNNQGVVVASYSAANLTSGNFANGQTFTFTAQNGSATGITLTISGAALASGTLNTATFNENTANTLSFALANSSGAVIDSKAGVAFGVATAFTMSYSGLSVNLTSQTYANATSTFAASNITVTGTTSSAAVVGSNAIVTSNATVAAGVLMDTQARANAAITTINTAINTVSTTLAQLGAVQNRLQHTINNLGAASQNMSSAQGNIKNVDMAAEMSEFTKDQVLSQAGVAMLAQANQAPQMILKLLG